MPDVHFYNLLMVITFIIGYFLITIEHVTKINKTSIALIMAIMCWIFQFANQLESHESNLSFLGEHLADISQIIFFLLGALTIVEIVNAHKGFRLISDYIQMRSKRKLLWLVAFIAFFLSAILDNLTTTIIFISLLRKLIDNKEDRLVMGGAVVIAANAGGAWTPIGDVTTTMLWIGGQLSTVVMMRELFIPSFICFFVSLLCLSFFLKGEFAPIDNNDQKEEKEPMGTLVFWLGLVCLVFVPIFKLLTGLPPFMGMMFGLALMWLFTDIIHREYEERYHLRVPHVITKIDVASVLFFLGILLCIDALHTAGLLTQLAMWMDSTISNSTLIAIALGLASAVVDNVPLVAAIMNMYDLSLYPTDSSFWNLIAYCAGTGGSILIIGSAAGVAFMGLENVQFFWYLRRISFPALLGYFAGIGAYQLMLKL
jgi:NhaD family Na+/H+ antiporter